MTMIPTDVLTRALEAADQAPSVHGTRPWWWKRFADSVVLCARPERRLATTDSDGRDLMISCGAALYSLQVAAAAAGWRARVHRLPDPASRFVVARVEFQPHVASANDEARAFALDARRTDRRAGPAWPVPQARLRDAMSIASARGVLALPLTAQEDVGALLALMAEAAEAQDCDSRYGRELAQWGQARRPISLNDVQAAWLVLATSSDDPLSWLRTGEALQAVWLDAAAHGLALVPHSQVIEVPATRQRVQEELFEDTVCPQLVLRVGWAAPAEPDAETRTGPRAAKTPAGVAGISESP